MRMKSIFCSNNFIFHLHRMSNGSIRNLIRIHVIMYTSALMQCIYKFLSTINFDTFDLSFLKSGWFNHLPERRKINYSVVFLCVCFFLLCIEYFVLSCLNVNSYFRNSFALIKTMLIVKPIHCEQKS